MKLDARNVRHLSSEDWRVLTAVEQGSRNHQIVPTSLIASIAALSSGKSHVPRHISTLAKLGLIGRVRNARYDGYRLTYGGLDYLALHAHSRGDVLSGVGERVGVGKEADIMIVSSPAPSHIEGTGEVIERVMKMHRLGRISFRSVKTNRDYLRRRVAGSGSWMYLSKLASQKEFAVLRSLWDVGFPVPQPVACNRHTVVMERINGTPLRQVSSVPDPAALYDSLIDLILQLAGFGLIHGDFNEFNILITEIETSSSSTSSSNPKKTTSPEQSTPSATSSSATKSASKSEDPKILLRPIIIDFPQTISTSHSNAADYFTRDVDCIKRFFARRFHYTVSSPGPVLADAVRDPTGRRLDVEVEASGFTRKMAAELEGYLQESALHGGDGVENDADADGDADEDADEEIDGDEERDRFDVHGHDDGFGDDGRAEGVDLSDAAASDGNDDDEPEDVLHSLPPTAALQKLALGRHSKHDDAVSVAGSTYSTRSRRNPPNPAKVASGWAI